MSTVALGMSGGVDSSVAIHLLQEAGHKVIGIHLLLSPESPQTQQALSDTRAVADIFGIPLKVFDERAFFDAQVVTPFVEAYRQGVTPNPCVRCNALVKFGRLWEIAKSLGCTHLATGHYVRIQEDTTGFPRLCQGEDLNKDQSYFLYALPPALLPQILFPLGEVTKEKVRILAADLKLPIANKGDSQEICFIPEDDYVGYLENQKHVVFPGQGSFVNSHGTTLGRHLGIHHYTIGQRKGLGLALGYPAYVTDLDIDTNTVTVGPDAALWQKALIAKECVFHSNAKAGSALVKIRSRDKGQKAQWQFDGETLSVQFDAPVRAVAPGQSAVLYEGDCLIGGGIIQA